VCGRIGAGTADFSHHPAPPVPDTLDRCIMSRPGILGGKPCIAGRRIAVEHIAVWHERHEESADEIAREYDLAVGVDAALAYDFAHREEIDRSIREGEATIR